MAQWAIERMTTFVLAVPDLAKAHDLFSRLGLTVSPPAPVGDTGLENSVFSVGSAGSSVAVELLNFTDRQRMLAEPRRRDLVELIDGGGGPYSLGFSATDADAARAVLGAQPGGVHDSTIQLADGGTVDILRPLDTAVAGCRYVVVRRPSGHDEAGPSHALPLKRVDHVAIVPPDLDAATRYWNDVLGVPVHADIDGPGLFIRQLKVGDVMVELLVSTDPNGRLANAVPGLRPTVAYEVDDVEACAALVRQRGFSASDPAAGALPGTVVSIVPATELAGLSVQLLQYR